MGVITADFAIIGAGIIGLTTALELKRRHSDARVVVLEKEPEPGLHASGRNSGVLHAGFYYTADSMKARYCRDGNRALTTYCMERGLPLHRCGKLVVARDEADLRGLAMLLERGQLNGVEVQLMSAADAKVIEPRVRSHEQALWSPTTSSVDPAAVMRSFAADAKAAGVQLRCGTRYMRMRSARLLMNDSEVSAGFVVNAAGLYADRIARDFGYARGHRIVPFKGLYLYSSEPAGALRVHVYPVPELQHPFLGVHFTVAVDGRIKIGPTAIPAFWREQYSLFEGFSARECAEVMSTELGLLLMGGAGFRALAVREMQKYSRGRLVALASRLIEGVRATDYRSWGHPGLRAQLVNTRTRALEMDFCVEGDDRSLHVLNAVSPAFTCALPFSRYLCDRIDRLIN